MLFRSGRARASETVAQVAEAGTKLDEITKSVVSISDLSSHIASAATEQSAVAEDMNKNISIINETSNQTTENTRHISTASNDLAGLANEMTEIVSKFKL